MAEEDDATSLSPDARRFLERVLRDLQQHPKADRYLVRSIERLLAGEIEPKPLVNDDD
jgi:hypothetical protein